VGVPGGEALENRKLVFHQQMYENKKGDLVSEIALFSFAFASAFAYRCRPPKGD
jgi:hypothetical protein